VDTLGPDPRLKPTPDYGTLGPNSDLQPVPKPNPVTPQQARLRAISAACIGALLAVVVAAGNGSVARAAWEQISEYLSLHGKPEPASPAVMSQHELEKLDSSTPQSQAQLLLERAINHYDGANDQIAARVDRWRGKIKLNPQLNSLFTTALNSNDLRVRAAAIEIDLAAYNITKTPQSVDRFARQADSADKATRVWALWMLGMLGSRGVEPERANEVLLTHLQDSDADIRMWAVEGLSYLGTDNSIAPLLKTFHDDSSPVVRERAACGLAQSGMLSQEQRRTAIPQLLDFLDDASLEANTRAWVFHALRDITAQNLPDDPVAWRNWYSTTAH
jgi:HEAT repeat protein